MPGSRTAAGWGGGGANTISFGDRGTITPHDTLYVPSGRVTIDGRDSRIDGGPGDCDLAESFRVESGAQLTLVSFDLVGGCSPAGGGAIFNLGTVSITGSRFSNNGGGGHGGAIYNGVCAGAGLGGGDLHAAVARHAAPQSYTRHSRIYHGSSQSRCPTNRPPQT